MITLIYSGNKIPKSWKTTEAKIDTSRPGLRNTGHYKMWLDEEGLTLLLGKVKALPLVISHALHLSI